MIIRNIKKIAGILCVLSAVTAYAESQGSSVACAVFESSCASQPTANNLYHRLNALAPSLSQMSPHLTLNNDVPILLSTEMITLMPAAKNMALLNNGLYLGAQANYNTRLNSTDYLFIQNPQFHASGDMINVLNVPVDLVDNSDAGGRVYVGYSLGQYLAVEERYTRFTLGNIHQMTDIEYNNYMHLPKNNAYELIVKQSVPLTHGISLLAKEGKALISTDLSAQDGVLYEDVNADGTVNDHKLLRTVVGLGTGFEFSENMTADIYYTYLLSTPAIHAQLISAGLTYRVK